MKQKRGAKTPAAETPAPGIILVVEDNPITLKLVQVTLQKEGYQVIAAQNGKTALEFAAKQMPDLILQDLKLPDIDGVDLVRKLRLLPGGDGIPIVAFTGFVTRVEEGIIANVGFTDFLIKPVEPSRLIAAVRTYLLPSQELTGRPGQGRHLLLVDDDPILLKYTRLQFVHAGFEVIPVRSGQDALDQARTQPPDVVLCDVLMPGMDGFQMCYAMRQDPALRRVPVVLMSANYVEEADRMLAERIGASAYVYRSLGVKAILNAVVESLSHKIPVPAIRTDEEFERERQARIIWQLDRMVSLRMDSQQRSYTLATILNELSFISETLVQRRDTGLALEGVLAHCLDNAGLSKGLLYLADDQEQLVLHAQYGCTKLLSAARDLFGQPDLFASFMRAEYPVQIPSPALPDDASQALLSQTESESALIIPIPRTDGSRGLLALFSTSLNLVEEDWVAFGRSLAAQIGQTVALSQTILKLADSELRYRIVTQATYDIVWDWDLNTNALWWNENFQTVFGYRPEEIEPGLESWTGRLHPDDMERVVSGIHKVIDSGAELWSDEYRFRRADSNYAHIYDRGKVIRDKTGHPVRMIGAMMDITERKRAEKALSNNQRDMLRAQTIAHFGNWGWDPQQNYVTGTEELFRIFGLEPTQDRCPLNSFLDRIHPDDQETNNQAMEAIRTGARNDINLELRIVRPDGDIRTVHAQGEGVYNKQHELTHIFGVTQDITDQKRAEQALARAELRFRNLLNSSPAVTYALKATGNFESTFCSDNLYDLMGYRTEENMRDPDFWASKIHPADREVAVAHTRRNCQEGGGNIEYRFRHVNGDYRWLLDMHRVIRDKDGKPLEIVGSWSDITESKQAEQKIQKQIEHLSLLDQITRAIGERHDLESIYQVVLNSLESNLQIDFGCICLHDQSDSVVLRVSVGACNPAGLDLQAQPRLDIHTNGFNICLQGELVYEPDINQLQFPFTRSLVSCGLRALVMVPLRVKDTTFGMLIVARQKDHSFSSSECEFLRQLSDHIALAMQQAQLYNALQSSYDDLRQTQQSVMQQDRLRALGQMASGIAHDINNALSPVALFTESILETEPNLSAKTREHLEIIQRAVDDVAQTIERMRDFYRQGESQVTLKPVQVNHLVEEVLSLCRARYEMPQQYGIVIETRIELAPDLPDILGIESEIRETLVNLVFNAVDALPEGGTLIIRTNATTRPEDTAPSSVVIEIADTGIGMDEETRQRCLEPFFTTKGERGTGLGLAMVYGMIQRHAGEIEIDSAPGAGTTVRLIFSIATTGLEKAAQSLAHPVPSGLRLLVVDDDPVLLKSMQHILETDGHVTVTASGGQNGINLFLDAIMEGAPFDVVITDLGMPHIDGRRVAAAVKEAAPTTPVILLTGWGQRMLVESDIPPHVDYVLSKPPKLQQLRNTLAICCRSAHTKPTA